MLELLKLRSNSAVPFLKFKPIFSLHVSITFSHLVQKFNIWVCFSFGAKHNKNLFIDEILWIRPNSIQNSKTLYIVEILIFDDEFLLSSSCNS